VTHCVCSLLIRNWWCACVNNFHMYVFLNEHSLYWCKLKKVFFVITWSSKLFVPHRKHLQVWKVFDFTALIIASICLKFCYIFLDMWISSRFLDYKFNIISFEAVSYRILFQGRMSTTVGLTVVVCNLFNTFVSFSVARIFNYICSNIHQLRFICKIYIYCTNKRAA
jgi:hypothetical protein